MSLGRAPAVGANDRSTTWPANVYLALVPLRVFLGVTLLYAGFDKLLSPTFLSESGPGSIGQQLAGFVRVSPIAPLITAFARPFPVEIGLLIALAEVAVGLGALTGLLYRASATVGFALSIMFWLTASWTTTPYYYGPDLPYAIGWLTLALAGHGNLYVLGPRLMAAAEVDDRLVEVGPYGRARARGSGSIRGGRPPRTARLEPEVSAERRLVLEFAVLAVASIAVATVGSVVGRILGITGSGGSTLASSASSGTSDGARTSLSSSAPPANGGTVGTANAPSGTTAPTTAGGPAIASLADVPPRHALEFSDPSSGDPAVLVRLGNGKVVAFDAVCTHAGCTVGYDSGSGLLLCPCHGAAFDPTHNGDVVGGPAPTGLLPLPISVDPATGTITLKA